MNPSITAQQVAAVPITQPKNWRVESNTVGISDRTFAGFCEAVFVAKSQTACGWPSHVRDIANKWIVWPKL